jgi:hypothetical protein
MSNVLGKKPLMVLVHSGKETRFLSNWYLDNHEVHKYIMQLTEKGYPLTIIPWNGSGDLINKINDKKRCCIIIFQKGDISTDINLKRLVLLCNLQGWILVQDDEIINKRPGIIKDVTSAHISLLLNNQLREYPPPQERMAFI